MDPDLSFTTYFSAGKRDGLSRRGRKRTKVIATIGPASESRQVLLDMFHAGMNVARLNMSHGTYADHERRLALVQECSRETERPIAILADLQGPKIRTGKLRDGNPVLLTKGSAFTITTDPWPNGDHEKVGTTYQGLAEDVKPGDTILINDGRLRLTVRRVEGNDVQCEVVVGGRLTDSKGINLPGVEVSAPALSPKDKEDLAWALHNDIDYLALSFVRTPLDVQHLRRRVEETGRHVPIIAKIEREEAVHNMDAIIREADGIMVARGDLGIEISTERLPVVQKALITRANAQGKLVITATQMLESMIENPIPTRAESSDVANAVFDGSDAVMLSGETAVGQYPVEAVTEMNRIAHEAEESPYMPRQVLDESRFEDDTFSLAMTGSAHYLAKTLKAQAIMVFTPRMHKPLLLSKRRSGRPCIAICHDEVQWRRLSLYWGIVPFLIPAQADPQDLIEAGLDEAVRQGVIKEGDAVVVLIGSEQGRARTLKVVNV